MRAAVYVCAACGTESPKWLGRCPACQAWNSLAEEPRREPSARGRSAGPGSATPLTRFTGGDAPPRMLTGLKPLDRVLGGGLVPGMGVLLGGDPGIGKSTLLLQTAAALAGRGATVLYATGEESGDQVALRARRLSLAPDSLLLLPETSLHRILEAGEAARPGVVVVDSIQTVAAEDLESAPGSVTQVRECAARLLDFAKRRSVPLFLVGHVTKDGNLAGPKTLEHLVDTVVYFEGEGAFAHRILRTVKNRFGPSGEIGVFEMTDRGLAPIENPSSLFLAQRLAGAPGSVVFCSLEGTVPVLVEAQALVVGRGSPAPRRWTTGFDPARASMLAAILEKRAGLALGGEEIYVNVAGGIRLTEPAADLPVACAVATSFLNRPARPDTVVFGEVGLVGEVRGVVRATERIREAERMGFRRCLLPRANLRDLPRDCPLEAAGVSTLTEALESLL